MKFCLKILAVASLALAAFGCAKQPSSRVESVTRGTLQCSKVEVYDPASNSTVLEDNCNTEFGLRGRAMLRGGQPVVLTTPAEAALLTAVDNPEAQRCQRYVIEMSDGTTREEEQCVPADARVITTMPARRPVNLGTHTRR